MSTLRIRRLLTGAGVLLALITALGALNLFNRAPTRDFVHAQVTRGIELRADVPDECWRFTYQSPYGGTIGALPQQCNGDNGQTAYNLRTGLLSKQSFTFKDSGRQRFYAEYGPDGQQVVRGFALRDDGSKLWDASPDGNGMVTTYTYWWNGTLFSIEKRAIGSWIVDRMYFRANGDRWLHYVGLGNITFEQARAAELPGMREAQLYDEHGKLAVDMRITADAKEASYTYYKPNGNIWYVQKRTSQYFGGPEGGAWSMAMARVTMYEDLNAKTAERQYEFHRGFSVYQITDIHTDGTRTVYLMQPNDTVSRIDQVASDGKTILESQSQFDSEQKIELPYSFQRFPDPVEPAKIWEEAERVHYRHTVVP